MSHSVLRGLLALLAPRRCAACGQLLQSNSPGFCDACGPLLEPHSGQVSRGSEVHAAFWYGGPMAEAIARLKFRGRTDVVGALGPPLVTAVTPAARGLDLVLAVPLHPRRLRERGYNQSALLAAHVAHCLSLPFRARWLQRLRAQPPQVEAGRAQRMSQLVGAFAASTKLQGRRVLLVDDVRTTGATLDECTSALLAAGAVRVVCAVVAQTPDA